MMGESTLEKWLAFVDSEDFVTSSEITTLTDIVIGYVSRDKLMEWQQLEILEKLEQQDTIIPAVKPYRLLFSLVLFILSFQLPPVAPNNVPACRCFSLLVLTVSLWITVAIQ
jgi:hypothetical protein